MYQRVENLLERKVGLAVVKDDHTALAPLVGCMTDAAGDVEFHLGDIDYPAHVSRFLHKMMYFSFKLAGIYRKRKYQNPGGWCFFTAEKWAEMLRMDKGQVQHLRARLVADGIIFYQPNLTNERDLDGDIADGRLIWNLTFAEWKPLQGEPAPYSYGGARQGAGRPHKKQSINANLKNLPVASQQEAGNANLKPEQTAFRNQVITAGLDTAQVEPESAPGYTQLSSLHWPVDKFALVATSESRVEQVVEVAVISNEKEEDKNEKNNPNGVALATPDALVGKSIDLVSSSSQDALRQAALFGGEPQKETAAKPADSSKRRAKKEPTPEQLTETERKAAERAVFEARTTALVEVWLAHPSTVKLERMSPTEQRGFYSGIAKLAHTSLTVEELPRLIDAQASYFDGTYVPDPHKMEGKLGTLRLKAARRPSNDTAKGASHAVTQEPSQRNGGQRDTGGADPRSFLRQRASHA